MIHVLVVNEEPEVRRGLRHMLEAHDFLVSEASDASDAMGAVRKYPVQVVITELAGGRDGSGLIGMIRARLDDRPWIVGMGGVQDGQLHLFEAAGVLGVDALLIRPIVSAQLIDTIQRLAATIRPPKPLRRPSRQRSRPPRRRIAGAE